ncbi:MAG: GNAT family N-acetyltransferase [Mucilaginibacter sp.]
MTKVLTLRDKQEWNAYILKAAEHDFYHSWHYHSLDTSGHPFLFIYENNDGFIGLPLIKRSIPGSIYYDLTCVYGYTGPFSNNAMEGIPEQLIDEFCAEFMQFLTRGGFVSVFVRLHPFYQQQRILQKLGGIHSNGLIVALDLSVDTQTQRARYRDSILPALKKAWKKGFFIKEEKGYEAVSTFIDIYLENMRRVGASDYYIFSEEQIFQLLATDEYDARMLMVYDGDTVIASTIVTFTKGIIQGYLVGTRDEYRKYSPVKFLVDEISLLGKSLGMKYYNLGGGLGYKEDSLFYWKATFSDLHLPYQTWRFIADPAVYQSLLDQRSIDKDTEVDFFPLYRCL